MAEIINRTSKTVPLGEVTPHPDNPRDGDVNVIWESIEQNGFYGAIVVQVSSGHILAGNHRYLAAKEAGLTEIPVHYVDVTDEEALRILTADNRTSDVAGYDESALADILSHLDATDNGLTGTGYGEDYLDGLLDELDRNGAADTESPEAEVDRAEELRKEWGTEQGQLWKIGRHRLLCGDSTNPEDVERLLDGAEPRLMVTDPPYGVEYDPEWRNRNFGEGSRNTGAVTNDDNVDWLSAWNNSPSSVVYCWHAGRFASMVQVSLEESGFDIRSQIVWAKQHFAISRGHYHWQHEPCWYGVQKDETAEWRGGRDQSTLWEIDAGTLFGSDEDDTGHGTQKPLECMERPIANHKGDVYEPFCGSGTTIVAAERLGRSCYAIELEPRYVAIILQRLSDMGLEPELIE